MKKLAIFALLFVLSVPFGAFAFSLETGSQININNEARFEENLYLVGSKVFVNNEIENDVFVVAGSSVLDGAFKEDIQAFVGKIILNGKALGDVRLLGGEININNETSKDLFIVGGKVNVLDGAILNGKTMIVAGEVNLGGKVNNDLKIISAKTNINGELNAKTEITSQQIYFGDQSKVKGMLNYFSPQKAYISSGAQIEADTRFNQIEKISENSVLKKVVLNLIIFWSVLRFLASLFLALILVFVFKVFSQRVSLIAIKTPVKSFFVGLISFFLIPLVCIILFASLFAIPVSIILGFVYLILLILTAPVSGIALGFYIKSLNKKEETVDSSSKNKKPEVDFNSAILGIVILTFVSFVPWVGEVSRILFTALSFGAMMLYYSEIIMKRKTIR